MFTQASWTVLTKLAYIARFCATHFLIHSLRSSNLRFLGGPDALVQDVGAEISEAA